MEVINCPFVFDREEFNQRIKIELYEGMEEEIDALLEKAVPLLKPKAVFMEKGVGIQESGGFQVGDQIFGDEVVCGHLDGLDRIFPYIATCGNELDEMVKATDDMLEIFWIDALKQMAMDRAFDALRAHVKEKFSIGKLYSLNPGSDTCREGWDISNQKKIFALLPQAEEAAGVYLTESLLMQPNKTVSGLLFQSERDYVSCLDCGNINCPNRRMIHEGAILS